MSETSRMGGTVNGLLLAVFMCECGITRHRTAKQKAFDSANSQHGVINRQALPHERAIFAQALLQPD